MTAFILSAFSLLAPPPATREAVLRTYHALEARGEVQRHPAAALPPNARLARIDASDHIRSISFGHSTTLVVMNPRHARWFFVEYGPSTNAPGGLFGPFRIERWHHRPDPRI